MPFSSMQLSIAISIQVLKAHPTQPACWRFYMSVSSCLAVASAVLCLTYGHSAENVFGAIRSSYTVWREQNYYSALQRRGGYDFEVARAQSAALGDEEPTFDFLEELDEPDEPGDAVVAAATCPVGPGDLATWRRHILEMAYNDLSYFSWLGAYLSAAHAWWLWRCWCPAGPREAEDGHRGRRVYTFFLLVRNAALLARPCIC